MAVYVDNMRLKVTVRGIYGSWSHMFADTQLELDQMAEVIGLRSQWMQNSNGFIHYDVTESKRVEAISRGAKEIEYRMLPNFVRRIFPDSQVGLLMTKLAERRESIRNSQGLPR